jgi:HEAT repeat protein
VRILPETKYPVTGVVLHALAAIGSDAKAALPALHSLLTIQDATVQVDATEALWSIGRETNSVLEICTNVMVSLSDDYAKSRAGFLLSQLLTAAAPAVPFALSALRDTINPVVARASAAAVLGAARVSTPEIRSALLEGTQSGQDAELRAICAMALWRLDSQYAPLATRLVLNDIVVLKKRFGNEQQFTKWLEARDLDSRQSIPTLRELLDSESTDIRKEAADALKQIDPEAAARAGVK